MGLVLAPLFVTVHNPARGINNPRALKLLQTLQEKGCYTSVLLHEENLHLLQAKQRVVLFDAAADDPRVNRWSSVFREEPRVPPYARALSSRLCVIVGKECRRPPQYAYTAKQLLGKFKRLAAEEVGVIKS